MQDDKYLIRQIIHKSVKNTMKLSKRKIKSHYLVSELPQK